MPAFSKPQYIFVYGKLMLNHPGYQNLGIAPLLKFISKASCNGRLYDIGNYPGLILEGDTIVQGELFEILDKRVFQIMDEFEEYFEQDIENSDYIRKQITLVEPQETAWVYEYRRSLEGKSHLEHGCWGERLKKVPYVL